MVLFDCLADVVSVCQSDAKTRGVQLEFSLEAAKEVVVMADDVMLQRVVLNIVKNSFESLADASIADARVSIQFLFQEMLYQLVMEFQMVIK